VLIVSRILTRGRDEEPGEKPQWAVS
jgi:hypothetical protein